jgi:hypothetical protein
MPPQRLIRRQSLAARLSSYPQDFLLSLNEAYELLEWDNLSNTLSIPFGLSLNGIYILACLDPQYQGSRYHEKDVFEGFHIRDSGVFLGNSGPLHSIVNHLPNADDSCIFSRGGWLCLALRMHCIVLRRGRIIAC